MYLLIFWYIFKISVLFNIILLMNTFIREQNSTLFDNTGNKTRLPGETPFIVAYHVELMELES